MDPKRFEFDVSRIPPAWRPQTTPVPLARGFSGMIGWRWQSSEGGVVLKGHPAHRLSMEQLAWQQRWRCYVHHAGTPLVPLPIQTAGGPTCWVGDERVWELQSEIPGNAAWFHRPTPADVLRITAALGKLHRSALGFESHRMPRAMQPAPAVRRRVQRIDEFRRWVTETWPNVQHRYRSDELRASASEAIQLFADVAPAARQALQRALDRRLVVGPCLRDLRPGDVHLQADSVAGFVDTAAADIDVPFIDVVRFLSELPPGVIDWPAAASCYADHGVWEEGLESLLVPLATATLLISAMNWVKVAAESCCLEMAEFAQRRLPGLLERTRRITAL